MAGLQAPRERLQLMATTWQSMDVDESGLPWKNYDLFAVDGVTADGRVIHKDPPVEVARISGAPHPIAIAPGQSMEGDIELNSMRVGDLPRRQDLLLLWSYWVGDGHSGGGGRELSGVAFLRAM